jgi:predicted amidohydrolase
VALAPGGPLGDLNGAADIAVRRAADGPQLVVVPELSARGPNHRTDEATVLALPAGFEATCAAEGVGGPS